jgi:hypothetical protein
MGGVTPIGETRKQQNSNSIQIFNAGGIQYDVNRTEKREKGIFGYWFLHT